MGFEFNPYAREEEIESRESQKPVQKPVQKQLFLVAVICSKYYNDLDRMKSAVMNALKNKSLTHEVRINYNAPANPSERSDINNCFIEWCNENGLSCAVPVMPHNKDGRKEVSNACLVAANAVITFDSSGVGSEMVAYAKNYAGRHKLMIKSY